MKNRPFWSTLYERDLDLLLLELIHSEPSFRAWLLSTIAPDLPSNERTLDFIGAWHSVTDELGHESDIVAEWSLQNDGPLVLFIEDKLAARCQPDQALRYVARAERSRQRGDATHTLTLLVAPKSYPSRHISDTAAFETHLAIEDIAAWCDDSLTGQRGPYIASLLRHMLRRIRPISPDGDDAMERFVAIYSILHEGIASSGSVLETTSSKEWVYFDFPGRRTGVWLRYRLPDNWIEIVFAKKNITADTVSSVFARAPLLGAALTNRGTTETAMWCPTPEIDLNSEIGPQRDRLIAALARAEMLRSWYIEHSDELHLDDTDSANSTSLGTP